MKKIIQCTLILLTLSVSTIHCFSYSTGELLQKIEKLETKIEDQERRWNDKIERNYKDSIKFSADGDAWSIAHISTQINNQTVSITLWSLGVSLILWLWWWFLWNYINAKYKKVNNIRIDLQKLRDDFQNDRKKYFEWIEEEKIKSIFNRLEKSPKDICNYHSDLAVVERLDPLYYPNLLKWVSWKNRDSSLFQSLLLQHFPGNSFLDKTNTAIDCLIQHKIYCEFYSNEYEEILVQSTLIYIRQKTDEFYVKRYKWLVGYIASLQLEDWDNLLRKTNKVFDKEWETRLAKDILKGLEKVNKK